jgi:sucrose-6F-phosphate phosphohydrolase
VAPRRLLISDLDGTLIGDPRALDRFAAFMFIHRDSWRIVYATGRSALSVWQAVDSTSLPQPDALLADVGTTIIGGDGVPWQDWPGPRPCWGTDAVRAALQEEPGLRLQAPIAQTRYKVSYHGENLHHMDLLRIARTLKRAGLRTRLVYSSARDLDVLPAGTGKGPAAQHLLTRWGVPRDSVVCAGDSGNDRDLLRVGSGVVIVGNALPDLRQVAARPGQRVVRSRRLYADGVLEGIAELTGSRGSTPGS